MQSGGDVRTIPADRCVDTCDDVAQFSDSAGVHHRSATLSFDCSDLPGVAVCSGQPSCVSSWSRHANVARAVVGLPNRFYMIIASRAMIVYIFSTDR
jgi:hypothetical protein